MQKILVVDDEPDIRKYLSLRLKSRNFEVVTARDGVDALEVAAKERPDLVLLDIKMPRLSGYEVLRHLREDPDLTHVPVIFVTAHADPKLQEQPQDVQADDFILKPFDMEDMMEKIRRLLPAA